ncbi:MAG TPA: FAD-dependent monooxygenase [Gemmatimonadales bacterium]|nr:FAD-dependent monooxygenase [Gemmatimonadales bacterium]
MTDYPSRVDVLVAGAGPAGSATAALLAGAGLSVLTLDRAGFPRAKPCSEYMSPETVRILSRLGVIESLEEAGAVPLEGLKVTAARGATAQGRFALASHPPFRSTGLSVARHVLDHELVKAARRAGATVLERTYVEELLYEGGAVSGALVLDRSGARHSIRARLTVGADGLRSIVARRLGRRTHGRPRRMAFVAHATGVQGLGQLAELHFSRSGYVGLNQIGRGQTNIGLVVPAERAISARGDVAGFFHQALAEFPEVNERVAGSTIQGPILATGPFSAWSRRVVAPGAVLVGDAADFFDPFTGDGIYSALRGAELIQEALTPGLKRRGPLDKGLLQYRRGRRRIFAGKWVMERLVGYAMYWPWLFERGVARMGRSASMGHTLVGVAGGFVPAREALNPLFLARMVF